MFGQIFGLALLAGTTTLHAQSTDGLLDKLVEKGILTVKEANGLREETDKNFTQAFATKTGLPDWVTSMRFNGDIRMRYDRITSADTVSADRDRYRYRLRFGYTATLKDSFEVGIGLTSSEQTGNASPADPISNNQSLQDNGSKKAIGLDKAYAKWTPINGPTWSAAMTIGKMENPIVFPSTILFDKDYTPEGFAAEVAYRMNDQHSFKGLGAVFVLDETSGSVRDPYMFAGQLRWDANWSPKWQSSIGGAVLGIVNRISLTTNAIPDIGAGNTRNLGTGILSNAYTSVYADASLTYVFDTFPAYKTAFPITVSGDFLKNLAAKTSDTGYSAGITFGKAGKKGLWEINYRYTHLEADAWFEEFVESDFGAFYKNGGAIGVANGYRSGTNLRGHWIKGTYNFYDSLSFSVAYFITELINQPVLPGAPRYDSGAARLFVEAVWKY